MEELLGDEAASLDLDRNANITNKRATDNQYMIEIMLPKQLLTKGHMPLLGFRVHVEHDNLIRHHDTLFKARHETAVISTGD